MNDLVQNQLKWLVVSKNLDDENKAIMESNKDYKRKVVLRKNVISARENYAASKIQAVIKGYLDRIECSRRKRYIRAVKRIQRVMIGKLGRLRWIREYWKSISIVKSEHGLKEMLERSSMIREKELKGKGGYHWKEMFDPLTNSFWYYNSRNGLNIWKCPLIFQKDLICPWNGYHDFGGAPHDPPCRSVFNTTEEYQSHLRFSHVWYCMACHQQNFALNFPKCSLCGNRYSQDGVDGEKVLVDSVNKIKEKLNHFLALDVKEKESMITYSIKDRLVELGEVRYRTKEKMHQLHLQEEQDIHQASRLSTADRKVATRKIKEQMRKELLEMNDHYIDQARVSYKTQQKRKKFVVGMIVNNYYDRRHDNTDPGDEEDSDHEHTKLPEIVKKERQNNFRRSFIMDEDPTDMVAKKVKAGHRHHHGTNDSTVPQHPQFDSSEGYISDEEYEDDQEAEENLLHSVAGCRTVTTAAHAREWLSRTQKVNYRRDKQYPTAFGHFTQPQFETFMGIHEENANTNLMLNLYSDSSDEEEKGTSRGRESRENPDLQKIFVCRKFLEGTCTLTTCPLAHPGVRDSARPKMKYVRQKDGSKLKVPYVQVCPDYRVNGGDDSSSLSSGTGSAVASVMPSFGCVRGIRCHNYHVYIRPTTQQILAKIYPRDYGIRTKEYLSGASWHGHVAEGQQNGYGVMQWRNGSSYVGDWKNEKRSGLGIYRTLEGEEYVGGFLEGMRHGWGLLTTTRGVEYAGQWARGKMEGVGLLRYERGDVYSGSFVGNKYEGLGHYIDKDGVQYIGYFHEGLASGRGILMVPGGEKYIGWFELNQRHGKGSSTHPNGSKYYGHWYRGAPSGTGVFLSPSGEKYIGEFAAGKRHGQGRYLFLSGDFYHGEFVKNRAKGKGLYCHTNGNMYSGEWDNDKRNGRGTYVFANGSKYTGNWDNNDIHGKGKFDYAGGCYYRGQFHRNVKHGRGIYTWRNGAVYKGTFEHGKLCGMGEMVYSTNHRYIGNWRDDKKNGFGKFRYSDGVIYEGDFVDDVRQGRGKITFFRGTTVEESYEGEWDRDGWHGQGTYSYRKDEGTVYEGQWVRGVREGTGILRFKDGSYYRGDFKQDLMWGRGVFVGADGSQYDGEWRKNLRHGIGTCIESDGSIYHGEFWGNMKQGHGKLIRSDGSVYRGTWDANVVVGQGTMTFTVGKKDKRDGLKSEITTKVFGY